MNDRKSIHSRYRKAPLRGARVRYRAHPDRTAQGSWDDNQFNIGGAIGGGGIVVVVVLGARLRVAARLLTRRKLKGAMRLHLPQRKTSSGALRARSWRALGALLRGLFGVQRTGSLPMMNEAEEPAKATKISPKTDEKSSHAASDHARALHSKPRKYSVRMGTDQRTCGVEAVEPIEELGHEPKNDVRWCNCDRARAHGT